MGGAKNAFIDLCAGTFSKNSQDLGALVLVSGTQDMLDGERIHSSLQKGTSQELYGSEGKDPSGNYSRISVDRMFNGLPPATYHQIPTMYCHHHLWPLSFYLRCG